MKTRSLVSSGVQRVADALRLRGPLADDPTAQVLHVLLLVVAIWMAFWYAVTLNLAAIVLPRLLYVPILEVCLAAALILLQRGHFHGASLVYLTGIWLWATLIVTYIGTIRSTPGVVLYVTLPVSAAWLLGYRAALWTAGGCIATLGVFACLGMAGVLVRAPVPTTILGEFSVAVQATLIGTIPVGQVLSRLQATLMQLQAEAAERQRREKHLNSIYNTVADVIFQLAVERDGQFRFIFVNTAFVRTTGLSTEAVVGKTVNEIIPEPSLTRVLEKYRQSIEENVIVRWEETSDYPAGRLIGEVSVAPVLDSTGRCTHLVGSVHDVTERKRAAEEAVSLQLQLAQAQKMESIGRLAGGLAHDFNNLHSVILLHADSALEQVGSEDVVREYVLGIKDTSEKAITLGRQLMAFSNNQVLQPEVLSLNSVIAETEKLVRRLIGEDVNVVFKPGPGLPFVRADRGQLGQIIMNLAVNSRDAMPEGGTFTIETAAVAYDNADARFNPESHSGPYVVLAVKDSGIGMNKQMQERIFEPFFTTKGVGKGTGLGLSVVYGIVKQSGGFITVDSYPGRGTEFRIYLPVVFEIPQPVLDTEDRPIHGGSETILLVEDEPVLRQKLRKLLEESGYQVLVASDGDQAHRLALLDTERFHLLLTDVVMPGSSGHRLAERLLTLCPQMKVLYMSGYPDPSDGNITLQLQPSFIQKPFTRDRLLRRVRELLDL